MPTDEERSEVAAGLRGLAEATARLPMPDSNLYSLLSGVVFNGADWDIHDRNPNGLFLNRLADLIDPTVETCELELTYSGCTRVHMRTYECDRCGKSCDNVYGEDYEFCPYCGRKVENADE